MVYAAKRDPLDQMIPATGRGKAEIASLIEISQHLYDILNVARGFRPPLQFALASSLATAGGLGRECKPR